MTAPAAAGPLESAAYFAVAECLTNVVKHAGAGRAWVRRPARRRVLRSWSATTAAAEPTLPGRDWRVWRSGSRPSTAR